MSTARPSPESLRLILASTSPHRRVLLARLGLPFEVIDPEVDEGDAKSRISQPQVLVETLAAQKAERVATRAPEATVIGSDQAAVLDGAILGKPGGEPAAIAQLESLAGREHELFTAVAIASGGELRIFTDVTRLRMRPLSRAQVARYIAADRPFDCAGAYKIEQRGIALFERIETHDFTAITGLPLLQTASALIECGFALP